MKRIIIIAAVLLLAGAKVSSSYAQVTRQGNTFVQVSSRKASEPVKTKFSWKDSKGNEYPVYVGKTGSCYVVRVSKKTGKEYKQYLGKEISAEVCKELGIAYKPSK